MHTWYHKKIVECKGEVSCLQIKLELLPEAAVKMGWARAPARDVGGGHLLRRQLGLKFPL